MKRREFFQSLLAGGAGLAVVACGGGDSKMDSGTIGNCLQNGTNITIGANHGHVLVVSKDDVAAGAAKTYDIMGTADHTHSVTVSAANFVTLAGNQSVTVQSSVTAAHQHSITVVCA